MAQLNSKYNSTRTLSILSQVCQLSTPAIPLHLQYLYTLNTSTPSIPPHLQYLHTFNTSTPPHLHTFYNSTHLNFKQTIFLLLNQITYHNNGIEESLPSCPVFPNCQVSFKSIHRLRGFMTKSYSCYQPSIRKQPFDIFDLRAFMIDSLLPLPILEQRNRKAPSLQTVQTSNEEEDVYLDYRSS
ncbi:hypothetical protein EYC80_005002 [Monilinia laxa]|uniref:Uncharacterized protein n=1 Tax=Monilinia laxa TaxID=61186 RepID=A0A5N6KIU8_MONLA|nr:hypothetical protein EYC80_005002 [Monilinia laxa]